MATFIGEPSIIQPHLGSTSKCETAVSELNFVARYNSRYYLVQKTKNLSEPKGRPVGQFMGQFMGQLLGQLWPTRMPTRSDTPKY